ncbi:unnamed protein product [Protopolystoma xenopodis]|uniref:F-box domain-containing protein n=1 Tax=Protopolystoma xenopodis TaxID=117903 RepID=A0A448XFG9_9PLAT|nr:unnamed protein product [Protopolystoma xenopodis]
MKACIRLRASREQGVDSFASEENDPRLQPDAVGINSLPNELMLTIFSYLNTRELLLCASVCERWRHVSSDRHVWSQRLRRAVCLFWTTIVCDHQPIPRGCLPGIHNEAHPRDIYVFLVRFVSSPCRHREYQQDMGLATSRWSVMLALDEDEETAESRATRKGQVKSEEDEEYAETAASLTNSLQTSVTSLVLNWWEQMMRSLYWLASPSSAALSQMAGSCNQRLAVLGPGFDRRATSHLFRKIVGTDNYAFEPVTMFPGHLGFGSGLTLRLSAEAQQMASIVEEAVDLVAAAAVAASTTPRQREEDFLFDLIHLYSLSGHLNHNFEDQFSRICMSRLFKRTTQPPQVTEAEVLLGLRVSEAMQQLSRELTGLIYVVDARDRLDQLSYLHAELAAILRGFPANTADQLPVLILYVMPKEEIVLRPETEPIQLPLFPGQPANCNIFRGYRFTLSWQGSLITPIVAMRLFELANPWRLQKCASNDVISFIQGMLWLKSKVLSR